MKEGKLSNEALSEMIISQLEHKRDDILIGPGVGEDCAAIAFGDLACVLTTDPITGATENLGELAVQISCNDIASSGLEPIALLMTLLLPLDASEDEPRRIMSDAKKVADKLGVAIIGGHTEFTSAVTRTVVSVTAVGKGPISALSATAGAQAGDIIAISKWAALEGTGIICAELEEKLLSLGLSQSLIDEGKAMIEQLSVLPEGKLASEFGVHSMHDVTEGGVYGAAWEMAEAAGLGLIIDESSVPIMSVTHKMATALNIDPYRLISSGVMMMAFSASNFDAFKAAADKAGILVTAIGELTHAKDKWVKKENSLVPLAPPDKDELYRVFQ